nr:hypothetical protein [uncultured Oscillibacter sp.]
MMGLIVWQQPGAGKRLRTVTAQETAILRVPFLQVEVVRGPRTRPGTLERRMIRAAQKLRQAGVRYTVLPADYPPSQWPQRHGVGVVSTLSLRRSLAVELVRRITAERGLPPGSVRIAVTAGQMTGELVKTVTELTLGYRYVMLDVPYGGEELCRRLRREYGVSLLLQPSREQLEEAQVLVSFDRRTDLTGNNEAVVALYEGAESAFPPLTVPPSVETQLPAGADRLQLLAALRGAGALAPGQISLSVPALDILKSSNYNTTL